MGETSQKSWEFKRFFFKGKRQFQKILKNLLNSQLFCEVSLSILDF